MVIKYVILSFLILNSVHGDEDIRSEEEQRESRVLIYSPFRWPSFRNDPFRELIGFNPFKDIDPMVNSRMDPLSNMRRENPFDNSDARDDSFKYRIQVDGYKPDEIKVKLNGDQLTVSGEHKENNDNETEVLHQTFVRKFTLPKDFKKDTMKSVFDGLGNLIITGEINVKKTETDVVEIPIEMGPSEETEKTEKNEDNKEV